MAKNTAINFESLVRQNTGTHFLDSGGENGRHWQQPLPTAPITVAIGYKGESLEVSISTAAFLNEHLEIDQKLTRWLRKQDASNYTEYADALAEKLQLTVLCSENTYNHETDFDQTFQFSVIGPKGAEWIYDDDCYLIVETHNGADVRGGYSDPVVCKLKGDSRFLDWNCGATFTEYTTAEGETLDPQEHDERYQIGYTANPIDSLNDSIADVLSVDGVTFKARLKDGAIVTGYIYANASNGGQL